MAIQTIGIHGLVGAMDRASDNIEFMACAHAKFTGEVGFSSFWSRRAIQITLVLVELEAERIQGLGYIFR